MSSTPIEEMQVGVMNYRVERRHLYKNKFAKTADMGVCHVDVGRIDIHDALSAQAALLTLVHEWLHAEFARIGFQALIKDLDTNLNIEEYLCDALPEAVMSTLRANPTFAKLLTGEIGVDGFA